jgi:hypothetical protein
MKKKLPTIKKSLIDFATKEDAKVIDKAFTKIALIGTAISFGALDEVHAADYTTHANTLTIPGQNLNDDPYPAGSKSSNVDQVKHDARNQLKINNNLFNDGDDQRNVLVSGLPIGDDQSTGSEVVEVPRKSVAAHHANHYNVIPGSSGGNN